MRVSKLHSSLMRGVPTELLVAGGGAAAQTQPWVPRGWQEALREGIGNIEPAV